MGWHPPPTLSRLGLFLLLMELGGCWVGQTPLPLLALWSGGSLLLEAGCWVKAEVVSQRLNTALVPICYLDKWLYANISLGLER